MNRHRTISAIALSLLTLGTLGLQACKQAEEAPAAAAPARPVRVASIERGPALPPVIATGVIIAGEEARLSFKVGGVIRDILVREGESVKAGQRLATLETAEVDAGVAQSNAAYEKAKRDLERGKQLFADDVLTREQLDDLGTAEAVARAQLSATQFNRRYAEINAVADGRVLRRLAEPRELVAAGQPILMVSRGDEGYALRLGLPDRNFVQVRMGDTAKVRFDAWPGRSFVAKVSERGEAADPRSGTFPLRLAIEPGDVALASGMIGRAEITPSAAGDRTLDYVPLSALIEGNAQSILLFIYDDKTQTARSQRVAVSFVTATHAALTEPLPAGTRVITDGASYLLDGDAVRIVE